MPLSFCYAFSPSGSEGRRETGYNSIPITLVGTVPIYIFFPLKVSALEDTDNDKVRILLIKLVPYILSSLLLQTELGVAR